MTDGMPDTLSEVELSAFSSCEVPFVARLDDVNLEIGLDAEALAGCVARQDIDGLCDTIAPLFDYRFGSIDQYHQLTSDQIDETSKANRVVSLLAETIPGMSEMPLFAQRYARYYLGTVVSSVRHVSESIIDECAARRDSHDPELPRLLLEQALMLRDVLAVGTNEYSEQTQEYLLNHEIVRNRDQLELVATQLGGVALGGMEVTPHSLMSLQPRLWGLLTSNRLHIVPDVNYRHEVNSRPKSHHSLYPVSELPLARACSSEGDYVSFIEAVSANTHNTYSSTLGFMHLATQDETGAMRMIEYPVSMVDREIAEKTKESENLTAAILAGESLPTNHDLWHNMIPVYAEGFILHHPDAPISYGGMRSEYQSFGRALRQEKEEYEIGVAMGHSRTINQLYDTNAELRESIHSQLDTLFKSLSAELEHNPENALVVDYLAVLYTSRLMKVFSPDHQVFAVFAERLRAVAPYPEVVTVNSCSALMYDQGLYDESEVRSVLEGAGYKTANMDKEDIYQLLVNEHRAALEVFRKVETINSAEVPSGGLELLGALQEIGLLDEIGNNGAVILGGVEKVRWLSIIGPQRRQLRGHMEKVHKKNGVTLGDARDVDPAHVISEQIRAINQDYDWYVQNLEGRAAIQAIAKSGYDVTIGYLAGDNQNVVGEQLRSLSESEDSAEYFTKFMRSVDSIIDVFVELDFTDYIRFTEATRSLIEVQDSLRQSGLAPQLSNWIADYLHTATNVYFGHRSIEQQHSITFKEEKEKLLQRVMSL